MKYKLTPFHFVALLAIIKLIIEVIGFSDLNGNAGLEVIGPIAIFAGIILILIIDFLLQYFVRNRKRIIIIELLLIAAGVIYYFIAVA